MKRIVKKDAKNNSGYDRCSNTFGGAAVDQFGYWAFSSFVLFDYEKSDINPETNPMLDE